MGTTRCTVIILSELSCMDRVIHLTFLQQSTYLRQNTREYEGENVKEDGLNS